LLGSIAKFGVAVGAFVAFLLNWQVAVVLLEVHPIVLPSPWRVGLVMWQESSVLLRGMFATGLAAICGLGLSVALGFAIGLLFSQSRWVRSALYPYVVFLQTVPIVAIAPLLITWFGYGQQTVILVACIISLFPVVSNVTTGLISIDENLLDLFRLERGSHLQTLIKLRIPHAIGHLVLGARVSAGLAVIGTIVGEFFVGTAATGYAGLGTLMTGWQSQSRTDALIAVVLASTLLGLMMLALVNFFEQTLFRRWTQAAGFERQAG
jgi:NitT/TauT family transport system permease protein